MKIILNKRGPVRLRPLPSVLSRAFRLRAGAVFCLAALLARGAVPLVHGWHVAGQEAALGCRGHEAAAPAVVSSGAPGPADHRHHDAEHCALERILLGGGPLLPGRAPAAGPGRVLTSAVFIPDGPARPAPPEAAEHSPRGPPLV